MTQGDRRPTRFEKGQRLKASELNGLAEAIEAIVRRMQGQGVVNPLNRQAVLQSDLLAAVNTFTDPSTALAEIVRRKANGDLELADEVVTVVNRFENISIDGGTYIKIEWIDGEWQPYAADCGPQSESLSFYQPSASASASVSVGGP